MPQLSSICCAYRAGVHKGWDSIRLRQYCNASANGAHHSVHATSVYYYSSLPYSYSTTKQLSTAVWLKLSSLDSKKMIV